MKVFFRNIHLYLSLAAGLVILICCFTGAVLVFEKDLQEVFSHYRYYVKQQSIQLPIEQLISKVKQQYPAAKISSVKIYPNAERSVELGVSIPQKDNKGQGEISKNGEQAGERKDKASNGQLAPESRDASNKISDTSKGLQGNQAKQQPPAGAGGRATHTAYVNPYSGQVIELYSYRETFFFTMFSLHRWLLGGDDSIGKTITGVSTFIFLFILITGIILWWPKNKAILQQRLKIKTNASWKRLNHDLHIVLGFYSAIFLFIFSFTALSWSFKWFNEGIYAATGTSAKQTEPPHSLMQAGKKRISFDSAFVAINKAVPDVQYFSLRAPSDSIGIYTATVLPTGAAESAADNYYIDQYSGQVVGNLKYKDKNLGQRVRSNIKPIHTGSIYGWPSKIIAFIVCLCGVIFPITGTIMWLNRLKKNKRKQVATTNGKTVVLKEDEDEED
ncbi:MAG: hypothetical protein JWQ96_1742 [Segetibacter sp.]|nr:hypothetical protein [Segetibacter sp.]